MEAFLWWTRRFALLLTLSTTTQAAPCTQLPTSIPAGARVDSLLMLGQLCRIQLLYPDTPLGAETTPSVPEGVSPDTALKQLLANTPLQAVWLDSDTIRLTSVPQLPPLEVHATPHINSLSRTGTTNLTNTAATRLEADQLQQRGINQISQLSTQLSGLNRNNGESRRDEFYIRGFKARREVLLDGMRDDSLYTRDSYNLESAELLTTASAATLSRGGSSGLLALESKKPQRRHFTDWMLTTGSEDHYQLNLDHNRPLTSQQQFRLNLLANQQQSFRDRGYSKQLGLTASMAWQQQDTNNWLQLELYQQRQLLDRGIIANPNTGQILSPSGHLFYGDPNDHAQLQRQRLQWQRQVPLADNLKYELALAATRTGLEARNTKPIKLNDRLQVHRRLIDFPQQQQDLRLVQQLLWQHSDNTRIRAGMELSRQQRDLRINDLREDLVNVQNPNQATPLPALTEKMKVDMGARLDSASLFFDLSAPIEARWMLHSGLRLDTYQANQHNRLTGSIQHATELLPEGYISLQYQPSDKLSSWMSLSRNSQTATTNLYQADIARFQQPAEHYLQWELGTDWHTPAYQLGLRLFQIHQQRRLLTGRDLKNGWPAQHPSGQSTGMELTFQSEITPHWQLSGYYNWLNARGTSVTGNDYQLENSARHRVSLHSRYHLSDNLDLTLSLSGSSTRYASPANQVRLPGYGLINLGLGYDKGNHRWQLQLQNLTDKRYLASANNALLIEPGTPRQVQFRLADPFLIFFLHQVGETCPSSSSIQSQMIMRMNIDADLHNQLFPLPSGTR